MFLSLISIPNLYRLPTANLEEGRGRQGMQLNENGKRRGKCGNQKGGMIN